MFFKKKTENFRKDKKRFLRYIIIRFLTFVISLTVLK